MADAAALRHYEALIAARYPPALACALAAARYQVGLAQPPVSLPAVRDALVVVQAEHPELRRDAGRTVAAIDRRKKLAR